MKDRKLHVSLSTIRLLTAATEKAIAIETACKVNDRDLKVMHALQAMHDYKDYRLENAKQFVETVCKCQILEEELNAIDTRAVRAFYRFCGRPEKAPVIGKDCSFDQFSARITAKPVKRLNAEVAL